MRNQTWKIELYVDGRYWQTIVQSQSTKPSPMQMEQVFRDISNNGFYNYGVSKIFWDESEPKRTVIRIFIEKR